MSASQECLITDDEKEFILHINVLDQSSVDITAYISDTIQIIKQKYTDLTETPIELQRYVYRGLEMNNNEPLSKYKINKETTIHAAIRKTQQQLEQERQQEFSYLNNDEEAKLNQNMNINDNNIAANNNNNNQLDPALVDRPFFDFLTCCTGYCTLCCLLPLISAPDIIALNVVNNWEINYNEENNEWNECIWSNDYSINISLFLNIGSLWSIISYSLFALWFFWYLKTSSFIVMNRIRADQLEWKGLTAIMASTKFMNNVWYILSFGLLVFSCIGIYIHDQQMTDNCKYSTIGIVIIAWSGIHLILSFIICTTLCLVCCCLMTSDNIFANINV